MGQSYGIPSRETIDTVCGSVGASSRAKNLLQLIDTLLNGDQTQAREAREQIVDWGSRAVSELVKAVPKTRTDKELWRVLTTLAEIGDPEIAPTMIEALKSSSSAISSMAAQCLAKLNDPRAVDPMLALLNQRPAPVSTIWLMTALGKLEAKQAVEPLLTLLHTTQSVPERYTAIEVLGLLGDGSVIEDIRRYESDPDQHVRERVQAALARLSRQRIA